MQNGEEEWSKMDKTIESGKNCHLGEFKRPIKSNIEEGKDLMFVAGVVC